MNKDELSYSLIAGVCYVNIAEENKIFVIIHFLLSFFAFLKLLLIFYLYIIKLLLNFVI